MVLSALSLERFQPLFDDRTMPESGQASCDGGHDLAFAEKLVGKAALAPAVARLLGRATASVCEAV
jgi:hypothetical protein